MDTREDGEQPHGTTPHRTESSVYEIRVMGHLDARWSAWFDGLTLRLESDGTTTIHGAMADQSALHGALQKVRDLGLDLISVVRTSPTDDSSSTKGTSL